MAVNNDLSGLWPGETVAILGAGPDMTAELAEQARAYKTIAVNRAIKFAPNADAFVALDPHHPFWEAAAEFKGLKFIGIPDSPYKDTIYVGMLYEKVKISDGHVIEIRNNALAAIRIAVMAGAKKIILLGFDPDRYEEIHFAKCGFYGLKQGLEQIIAELRGKGIEIERMDSPVQFPGKPRERRKKPVKPA
jgi:hypothetical protein